MRESKVLNGRSISRVADGIVPRGSSPNLRDVPILIDREIYCEYSRPGAIP
jgi:hypothetical protein